MPTAGENVTDSWRAYQTCMKMIHRFLNEIEVKNAEAWVGDVCFGSPDHPVVKAPLRGDSVERIHDSVERAKALVAVVLESLQNAVKTSRSVMDKLRGEGDVDSADLADVVARTNSLEQLLAELTNASALTPITYHPATLIRWREMLGRSLVPGDPALRVKVVTVHVL